MEGRVQTQENQLGGNTDIEVQMLQGLDKIEVVEMEQQKQI